MGSGDIYGLRWTDLTLIFPKWRDASQLPSQIETPLLIIEVDLYIYPYVCVFPRSSLFSFIISS